MGAVVVPRPAAAKDSATRRGKRKKVIKSAAPTSSAAKQNSAPSVVPRLSKGEKRARRRERLEQIAAFHYLRHPSLSAARRPKVSGAIPRRGQMRSQRIEFASDSDG